MECIINISGASTKGAFNTGALEYILQETDYKPTAYSGISFGAIAASFAAMGLLPSLKEELFKADLCTIFDKKPVNKHGRITLGAIWRGLKGQPGLGSQDNLEKLLRKHLTSKQLWNYQHDENAPDVYIGAVNLRTKQIKYWNLHDRSDVYYNKAIAIIMASTSIPVFTPPVLIEGDWYVDGGVIDHIGSEYMLKRHLKDVKHMVNIYSRPAIAPQEKWVETQAVDRADIDVIGMNVAHVLTETIDTFTINTSIEDEKITKALAEKDNVSLLNIFAPYKLTSQHYEIKPSLSKAWYNLGYEQAKNQFNSSKDENE